MAYKSCISASKKEKQEEEQKQEPEQSDAMNIFPLSSYMFVNCHANMFREMNIF